MASQILTCPFVVGLILVTIAAGNMSMCLRYPWQAYLYYSKDYPNLHGSIDNPITGVTIVSQKYVLTLAKFLYGDNNKLLSTHRLIVVYGCGESTNDRDVSTVVESINVFPEYKNVYPWSHNIAILRVRNNIKFGTLADRAELPVLQHAQVGMIIDFAEWDVKPTLRPSNLDKSMILNVVELVNKTNCPEIRYISKHHKQFCGKAMWTSRRCADVRGTGLVHDKHLVGIQEACDCEGAFRIYIDIRPYINWVYDNGYVTAPWNRNG